MSCKARTRGSGEVLPGVCETHVFFAAVEQNERSQGKILDGLKRNMSRGNSESDELDLT